MMDINFGRKYKVLLLILLFISYQATLADPGDDVLVVLNGKILDASTMEPVEAKLTYKLMPGGSVTGIRMFANQDGKYNLQLEKYRSYRIEVRSEDYQPQEVTIETDGSGNLRNNFLLYRIPSKGEIFPLSKRIFFERGKYVLSDHSIPTLQTLAEIMQDHPKMVIRLEGHTDQGSLRSLLRLSENRVDEVKRYLVDVMGVEKRRIKTKAYGGRKPITTENTPEARRKNRRVEIRVLKL